MDLATKHKIIEILAAERPNPKSEPNYKTPFELLIAVMLSAQATDKSVNIATKALFKAADNPAAMLSLGVDGLEPFIRTIGLYHNKARHIMDACQVLVRDFNGSVPDNFEDLISLPGVGAKTADVVLNVAFGRPTVPVDTHVFRVANRTGLAPGKTPAEVSKALIAVTPPEYLKGIHHWLLLHGRYCCKARNPLCSTCPIRSLCAFEGKLLQAAGKSPEKS